MAKTIFLDVCHEGRKMIGHACVKLGAKPDKMLNR